MNKLSIATLALATVGLTGIAAAQYEEPLGLSVRAGFFFPGDSAAQDEADTFLAVGVDYEIKPVDMADMYSEYNAVYSISLDYYGSGDYSHVPLLINYVGRSDDFYYSLGAGLGFTKTPDGLGGTESETELAYALGVGYDFTQGTTPVFVELKYQGSAKSELNGFGLYGGVRF
jgi:hypothetical protein